MLLLVEGWLTMRVQMHFNIFFQLSNSIVGVIIVGARPATSCLPSGYHRRGDLFLNSIRLEILKSWCTCQNLGNLSWQLKLTAVILCIFWFFRAYLLFNWTFQTYCYFLLSCLLLHVCILIQVKFYGSILGRILPCTTTSSP